MSLILESLVKVDNCVHIVLCCSMRLLLYVPYVSKLKMLHMFRCFMLSTVAYYHYLLINHDLQYRRRLVWLWNQRRLVWLRRGQRLVWFRDQRRQVLSFGVQRLLGLRVREQWCFRYVGDISAMCMSCVGDVLAMCWRCVDDALSMLWWCIGAMFDWNQHGIM